MKIFYYIITSRFYFTFFLILGISISTKVDAEVSCDATLKISEISKMEMLLMSHHYDDASAKKSLSEYSEGEVICLLLNLRNSGHPRMAPRAEKLLLNYSSNGIVKEALLSDVANHEKVGLVSVILSNLNLVNEELSNELVAEAKNKLNLIKTQKLDDSHSMFYQNRVSIMLTDK